MLDKALYLRQGVSWITTTCPSVDNDYGPVKGSDSRFRLGLSKLKRTKSIQHNYIICIICMAIY